MFQRTSPWACAVISGLLMAATLPPWNFAMLAWVAWIPLLACLLPVDEKKEASLPFSLGCVTGWSMWGVGIFWLRHVSWPGMVLLSLYLGLYMGAWAWAVAWFRRHWPAARGWTHLLVGFFGSAAWVVLEWVRGWMLGGFPWNQAAVSQHQNLSLIQVCEWTGTSGVSFVIIFFNITFWLTWRRLKAEKFSARPWRYEFSVAIFLVAVCLFIGMRHIFGNWKKKEKTTVFQVALVQPHIPQEVKFTAMSRDLQEERLEALTRTVAAGKPSLILWPETAVVNGPGYDEASRQWLQKLGREIQIPILLGAMDESPGGMDPQTGKPARRYFNAVLHMDGKGDFHEVYRKIHLVPFGEFVPLEKWFPWMRRVTPIGESMGSGDGPILFSVGGYQWGPLICFEDALPELSRQLAMKGADVLVNFTNDAWFKDSPAAAMHAANAVFRAVETRKILVRCTNHGRTVVFGPEGQVMASLEPFVDGFITVQLNIRKDAGPTFFVRHGHWFVGVCAGIILLEMGLCWRKALACHQPSQRSKGSLRI